MFLRAMGIAAICAASAVALWVLACRLAWRRRKPLQEP